MKRNKSEIPKMNQNKWSVYVSWGGMGSFVLSIELDAPFCTFPWSSLCLQAKNKENLCGAEGEDMTVLFHLLTASWGDLHAAHMLDVEKYLHNSCWMHFPSLVTSNLKQCFSYEWPLSPLLFPTFPTWWLLFFPLRRLVAWFSVGFQGLEIWSI